MSRLIFVLISLLTTSLYAAEVTDLYQSHAAIANQSDEERQKATVKILQQVLLKVVGDSSALAKKDISPLLSQAEQFVTQYAYQKTSFTEGEGQQLHLTFDEKTLNQAISATGLPIWEKSRPESLIWLVINNGNRQKIVGAEDVQTVSYNAVKQAAAKRGLPLYLPLMDLQDQHQLKFAQTTAKLNSENTFIQASKRYGTDIVIVARVNKKAEQVIAKWQWLVEGEVFTYSTKGTMKNAMSDGINHISDTLAGRFAVVDTQATKRDYVMVINNVNDFTAYTRIQSYLNGLQAVSEVNIESLRDKQLTLRLRLASGLTIFNQLIKRDGLLTRDHNQVDSDPLLYRLNP